jgi:hypothetical protein
MFLPATPAFFPRPVPPWNYVLSAASLEPTGVDRKGGSEETFTMDAFRFYKARRRFLQSSLPA